MNEPSQTGCARAHITCVMSWSGKGGSAQSCGPYWRPWNNLSRKPPLRWLLTTHYRNYETCCQTRQSQLAPRVVNHEVTFATFVVVMAFFWSAPGDRMIIRSSRIRNQVRLLALADMSDDRLVKHRSFPSRGQTAMHHNFARTESLISPAKSGSSAGCRPLYPTTRPACSSTFRGISWY